jgi:hypothetical protein
MREKTENRNKKAAPKTKMSGGAETASQPQQAAAYTCAPWQDRLLSAMWPCGVRTSQDDALPLYRPGTSMRPLR